MGERCEFIAGTKPPSGVFQQAISLGGGCPTALHLQRKFGRLVRSPFDWTLTPFFSLMRILEDDGVHLGEDFFQHAEGIACAHYGLIYYHEFPRIEGEIRKFNSNLIAECRSKLMHKMSKMAEACRGEYRTLFIRMGKYGDGDEGNPVGLVRTASSRKVTVSALNDLVGLLGRKFRNLDFHVVYIDHVSTGLLANEEMDAASVSRLSILHMPKKDAAFSGENHPGKFPQWDEFFSTINLTADSPYSRVDNDRRY